MSFWRRWLAPRPRERAQATREPRVRLLLADGAHLESDGAAFSVLNLSESGIAFFSEAPVPTGRRAGTLRIGGEALPVEFEVVRQSGTQVGARFVGGAAVGATLRRLFTDELRATEMSEATASHHAEAGAGTPRWFYSAGDYELFFLEAQGRVASMQMAWAGRVAMAAPDQPLRIGSVAQEDRAKPSHAKAQLVRWEGQVTAAERAKMIRIIENIPGLDGALKGQLTKLARDGETGLP